MEIKHRILVFNNNPQYDILKRALDDLGVKYEYKPNQNLSCIICLLKDNDPNYENLKTKINNKHVLVQTGMYYTQEDLDESEWFYINTSESQYPQGEGDYHNATYDLSNWCKKCGAGAFQNRPFRLLRDFQQKRDHFFGLHWVFDEIFARPSIKPILEENRISGFTYLNPVYHKSGKVIETSIQLKIDPTAQSGLLNNHLNPIDYPIEKNSVSNEDMLVEYCSLCKRAKYRYPKTDIIRYERTIFDGAPDIFKSQEYFGSGGQAQRLVFVSKRFYQVIKKYKLHGLVFTPIKLM